MIVKCQMKLKKKNRSKDRRIKEKIMSEKLNKKTGVCILAGISLHVIIIVISVIATGKEAAQSGEVSHA